ncbi:hypothetical protein, partial [Streptomyces nigra]
MPGRDGVKTLRAVWRGPIWRRSRLIGPPGGGPSRPTRGRCRRGPLDDVASVVGRQTPLLALVVPLVLVGLVDGRR